MLNSGNSLNCLCNINPQVTLIEKSQRKKSQYLTTVVGDNINIMKMTFLFKFLLLTSFFRITSLKVIKEKLF